MPIEIIIIVCVISICCLIGGCVWYWYNRSGAGLILGIISLAVMFISHEVYLLAD